MVFILSLQVICISQDSIYILHPVIGEIIDRNEKTDYELFPEISNTRFEYSYIKKADGNFWLKSHVFSDSLVIRQLDTTEIHQLERNIANKIACDPGLLNTKTGPGDLRSVVVKPVEPDPANNPVIYPETIERINSEAISNARLRDDAELQKLWRHGSNSDNGSLYIDFSYRKKKK